MAVNFYKVKETIRGKEYEAQFNGISAALKATDSCYIDGTQNISSEKIAKYIFEHVIVSPKGLIPDDFDDFDEFNEVLNFGQDVMKGKFREKANKGTVKTEDKG